jgi:hypothetical protein
MSTFREGHRVRLRESHQTGTVVEVAKGNAADSVLVEWDGSQLDSHWNRYTRSWHPSPHLEKL